MSYIPVLRNVSLLAHVNDEDLEALASEFILQSFRKDQVVFRQGSTTNSLYIVKSGNIQITAFGRNKEVTYKGIVGPDQYFGEFSLLDGLPRSAEAIALSNSDLLVLTRPTFFRFLEHHVDVAIRLLVTVSRRMRFAESAVEQTLAVNPEQRIAQLLIDIAEHYGTGEHSGQIISLDLRVSSDDLAGLSGATRDSANAIVSAFHTAGLIIMERSHIVGVDVLQLRARLGSSQRAS